MKNLFKVKVNYIVLIAILGFPDLGLAFTAHQGTPAIFTEHSVLISRLLPIILVLGVTLFIIGVFKYFFDIWKKHPKRTISKMIIFTGLFLASSMIGFWWYLGYTTTILGLTEGNMMQAPPVFVVPAT